MGRTWARPMHSMKEHFTLHTMSTVWISDSRYNTGTDAEADVAHHWCHTHCTLTQHTTHSAGEMAGCVHGSLKALSDVMHWVHKLLLCCCFYCNLSPLILPLAKLHWSLEAFHCSCCHWYIQLVPFLRSLVDGRKALSPSLLSCSSLHHCCQWRSRFMSGFMVSILLAAIKVVTDTCGSSLNLLKTQIFSYFQESVFTVRCMHTDMQTQLTYHMSMWGSLRLTPNNNVIQEAYPCNSRQ